ncbi:helix-turn-helix domain-containing protein [uncultured Adlercreutzia sp.]|uniref:helix-turn-helix domain-containing protein n=1 Tax=uncultured Adlercreutzia sp. TaxID=875803 RepID=UPI003510AC65
MGIVMRLDVMLADRKMSSKELAEAVGINENNLSRARRGRIRAIRFSTLGAMCKVLNCKPGDILDYVEDDDDEEEDFSLDD